MEYVIINHWSFPFLFINTTFVYYEVQNIFEFFYTELQSLCTSLMERPQQIAVSSYQFWEKNLTPIIQDCCQVYH